jgi:hypothetical protein
VDNQILYIKMPRLSDEAVGYIENFLWDIIDAFEMQYYDQLERYHASLYPPETDQPEDLSQI